MRKKLTDMCTIQYGYAFDSKEFTDNSNFPQLVRIRDIKRGYSETFFRGKYSLEYIIHTGDLLIGMDGEFNIARWRSGDALLNQRVCKVTVKEDVDEEYLRFSLSRALKQIENRTSFVTVKHLSTKELNSLELECPNIQKQKEISDRLVKIEEIISLRQQQLAKLDELVKARFVEMFGDPFLNLMNWNKIKIANAVTVEPQNGMYKPQSNYVTDGTGTPILRIDSFYDGEVTDFSLLKRLVCNEEEKQKYALREDDIIINRVNSIEYLGKCARITGLKEETVYESNMMRMHFDSKRFNPIYIIQLLCSQFIYRQIVNHAKKAVNQASINQKDVLDFDIYEPPIELQNTFGGFVKQTEQLKLPIQKSIEQMETLKKALMQQYFG